MPFLQVSFNEVFKVISYPQEDIKRAAIDALAQFCINFSKNNDVEGTQATQKAVSVFIPKLSEIIRLDFERPVVISALDGLAMMLKEMKSDVVVGEGHKDAIMNCITEILSGKINLYIIIMS